MKIENTDSRHKGYSHILTLTVRAIRDEKAGSPEEAARIIFDNKWLSDDSDNGKDINRLTGNVRACWDKATDEIEAGMGNGTTSNLQYCGFWSNDRVHPSVSLSTGKLAEYMANELGYRITREGQYVQIIDGVIYERTTREIYHTVVNLVSEEHATFRLDFAKTPYTILLDTQQLKTKAQQTIKGNLSMFALPKFDSPIFRDTATDIYFHFQNKTAHVMKDGVNLIDRDNSKCVWESQVIKFDIPDDPTCDSEFEIYLSNIAGENYNSFVGVIGYLLRNFNGSDGLRAVWLTDSDYEVGKKKGRTGKSILWKAVGKLRNSTMISGKDFMPDSQFKFQNMTLATQLYAIDDVKDKFDFHTLYNACTEGVEYQRKHQPLVQIPIEETAKLVITSNHPPKVEEGSSTTGRLITLPVKPFYAPYSDAGGIKAFHGHTFFDDWDSTEWASFYWFMMRCAEVYLRDGVEQPDQTEIRKNRLKEVAQKRFDSEDIAEDFCNWIYGYTLPEKFSLAEPMKDFNGGDEVKAPAFGASLRAYLDMEGIKFTKKREREEKCQVTNWRISKK